MHMDLWKQKHHVRTWAVKNKNLKLVIRRCTAGWVSVREKLEVSYWIHSLILNQRQTFNIIKTKLPICGMYCTIQIYLIQSIFSIVHETEHHTIRIITSLHERYDFRFALLNQQARCNKCAQERATVCPQHHVLGNNTVNSITLGDEMKKIQCRLTPHIRP